MKYPSALLTSILLALLWAWRILNPTLCSGAESLTGLVDPTFNPGVTPNGQASVVLQPDGKVIVLGSFAPTNGLNSSGMIRLNADGSLDAGFRTGSTPLSIFAMALQPDGKLLASGPFNHFNGTEANGLVRLNPDGSADPTFNIVAGPSFPATGYAPIFALALQADGKVVIGGDFQAVAGHSTAGVARLLANGSIDPSFKIAGDLRWVYALAVQSDGKILVGNVYGITRFNGDGSSDQAFQQSPRPTGGAEELIFLPDGKVLAAGLFGFQTKAGVASIIRLLPDGSLDNSFAPFAFGRNHFLVVDGKQRILLGGIPISNDTALGLVRLNPDGSRDWSLDLVTGLGVPLIQSAAVEPDGKILIAGQFSEIDGVARPSIARINETNRTSTIFLANSEFYVSEADTNLQVPLVRHGNTQNQARVAYETKDGTATNGVEYLAAAGTVEFTAGERAKTFPVALLNDHRAGPSFTTFKATLSQTSGDATLGSPASAVVSIKEADPIFTLLLDATNYSVSEFGPAITLTVLRADPPGFRADLLVDYATSDGSAQAGKDYGAVSGTLTFLGWEIDRPGPDQLPVSIPIYDNAVVDGRKDFYFTLTNPRFLEPSQGQVVLGSNVRATITIIDNDTATGAGQGADGPIQLAAAQPDGKILIVGSFNIVNGITRHRIARLNSDLSLDTTFDAGGFTNSPSQPLGMLALPDGKSLLWGVFGRVIVRLNGDGSVDRTFNVSSVMPVTDNPAAVVAALSLPNGQYLVAGDFVGFNNTSRSGVARLTSNGALDSSLDFHIPGIYAFRGRQLAQQTDGRTLVGGLGVGGDLAERGYLVRLMPNGSLDPSFSAPLDVPSRFAIIWGVFSDGKILLGDNANLALLRSDGSFDPSFNPGLAGGWISTLRLQANDQVLFAGSDPLGGWSPVLGWFSESGHLDANFRTSISGYVSVLVPLPGQRIFIAGSFTAVDAVPHFRFALLQTDGHVADAFKLAPPTLDATRHAHLASSQLSYQTILVQASTNLTDWTPIFTNLPLTKLQCLDPASSILRQRFYRATPVP